MRSGRVILILFVSVASPGWCEDAGFPFLRLGVGAQAQALGGANTARVVDASATYWNPAALAHLTSPQLFLYQAQLGQDERYNYLAYVQPLTARKSSLGVAFGHFSKGPFERRNDQGRIEGDFRASDSVGTLSYGFNLTSRFSLGLGVSAVQSRIDSFVGNGVATDFAGSYRLTPKSTVAAGIYHLGPAVKFEGETVKFPTTLAVGVTRPFFSTLLISGDVRYGVDQRKAEFSLGSELPFSDLGSLRIGYLSRLPTEGPQGSSNPERFFGFGAGLGLILFSKVGFDYAFTPMGIIGDVHHLSLNWRFQS